jgi:hypothetical protein
MLEPSVELDPHTRLPTSRHLLPIADNNVVAPFL